MSAPEMAAATGAEPGAAAPTPRPKPGPEGQGDDGIKRFHGGHVVARVEDQDFDHVPHAVLRVPGRHLVEHPAVMHDPISQDMELLGAHASDVRMCHVRVLYEGHDPAVEFHVVMMMVVVMLHGPPVVLHGVLLMLFVHM